MSSSKADRYFESLDLWQEQLMELRNHLITEGFDEEIKWARPCYSWKGKMILGLSGFKRHYGLWFFQGVFINDIHNILTNAQKGKTQAMRQLKMDENSNIKKQIIHDYINEARLNSELGKVYKHAKKELIIPDLLDLSLKKDDTLKTKFELLNLTKKREFAEYIDTAKREQTKLNRLSKIIPMIMDGIGLNDKYRK